MAKIAIVYWSGTGNTEAMANYIAEGVKAAGEEVDMYTAADFNSGLVGGYTAIAFGCPSMGDEELEEVDFAPMWDDVKGKLNGKKIVLFGSYGWGSGDWMNTWEEESPASIEETYICNETPGDEEADECRALGGRLAK